MTAVANLWEWLLWPLVFLCSAGIDSIYCGLESGMYAMNKIRLDIRAEEGHATSRFLKRMLAHPNNMLAVLLIGTNLMRYIATFAITSMFMLGGASNDEVRWLTIAVTTPLLFVIGDAVPKNVFHRDADKCVYATSWLMRVSNILFKITLLSPFVLAISSLMMRLTGGNRAKVHHRTEGLGTVLSEGTATGVLTHNQSIMAERLMQLRNVTLADVMIPMRSVVRASRNVDRDRLMRIYRQNDFSRIPLLDGAGQVVGLLNMFEALTDPEDRDPSVIMTPPLRLDRSLPVSRALFVMQRAHAVMAVVHDNRYRDVGIVTVKDLVEEIVGEIEDW